MKFVDIKPFIRLVHRLYLDNNNYFNHFKPYDARIFYVLNGECVIETENRKYILKKGSIIIINSGVKYHIMTPDSPVKIMGINFDYTFSNSDLKTPIIPATANSFEDSLLVEHVEFDDASVINTILFLEEASFLEKKLISLEREYSAKLNMYEVKMSSILTDILVNCYRKTINNNTISDGKDVVNKIVDFIIENCNENLTNKVVGDKFNFHPNYISTLIKSYTGLPLHKYLNNIRLMKATELLLDTGKTIGEISVDCGFYDTSHFVRCFKELFSVTPKQYRENFIP